MPTAQDYIHDVIAKFTTPKHGNNTEARRAEKPQASKPADKPQTMPKVEQALKDAGA